MGSIKFTKQGKQTHWSDKLKKFDVPRIPRKKPQYKNLPGQLPLFQDNPIDHLEPKKK